MSYGLLMADHTTTVEVIFNEEQITGKKVTCNAVGITLQVADYHNKIVSIREFEKKLFVSS